LVATAPLTLMAQPAAALNVIVVTTTADGVPGSLRAAFDTANTDGDDSEIVLQSGAIYLLTVCGATEDANANGDLDHTDTEKELTITGNGASVVQTCAGERVIHGLGGSGCTPDLSHCWSLTLRITNLNVAGGNTSGNGGAILAKGNRTSTGGNVDIRASALIGNAADGDGGAIWSAGVYSENSRFSRNRSGGAGGAVSSPSATVSVVNSTFDGNTAQGDGGAIDIPNAGINANAINSTFTNNRSVTGNGGAVVAGQVSVNGSTFDHNVAGVRGGAIAALDLTATNSTISENSAASAGGGIAVSNPNLTYVTVAENSAPSGANLHPIFASGTLTTFGSVIALGTGGGTDCAAFATVSNGYNFDSDGSCGLTAPTDRSAGGDPALAKLRNNGGPTLTREPKHGSPLIDVIPTASCGITVDQRGVVRPQNANCDIGAVELSAKKNSA